MGNDYDKDARIPWWHFCRRIANWWYWNVSGEA